MICKPKGLLAHRDASIQLNAYQTNRARAGQ